MTQRSEDLCFQNEKAIETCENVNDDTTTSITDSITNDGFRDDTTIKDGDDSCKTEENNARSENEKGLLMCDMHQVELDQGEINSGDGQIKQEMTAKTIGEIERDSDNITTREKRNVDCDHTLKCLNTIDYSRPEYTKQTVASKCQNDFKTRIKNESRNDKYLKVVHDIWSGDNAYIGLTDDFLIKLDADTRKIKHWIITDGRGEEYEDTMRLLQKMPPIEEDEHEKIIERFDKVRVMLLGRHLKDAYKN